MGHKRGSIWGNRSGLAALEFALIAPLVLITLFAGYELTEALGAARRAENTAASIAEVISRDVTVSNSEMTDVFGAVDALMTPTNGDLVSVRVTSVMVDASGNAEVVWCNATVAGVSGNCSGTAPFTALNSGDPITLPAGLAQPSAGLVRIETVLAYTPPLGIVIAPSGFQIRHTEYRRPRVVDPVQREGVSWTPS